jgi:hypothetical protein
MSPSHAYYLGCKYAFAQMTKTALMAEAQGAVTGLRHLGGRIANFFRGAPKNTTSLEQLGHFGGSTSKPVVEHVSQSLAQPAARSARGPVIEKITREGASPLGAPTTSASPIATSTRSSTSDIGPRIRRRAQAAEGATPPAAAPPATAATPPRNPDIEPKIRRRGKMVQSPEAPGAPGTPKATPGAPEAGKQTSWGLPLAGGLGLGMLGSHLFNSPK